MIEAWNRRLRALPGRHGGIRPLIALTLVLALALGLRLEFARNHIAHPTPDSRGYARIAESLYSDGQFGRRGGFGGEEVQDPTNYSPGLPLFAAGIYYATGGVKPLLVRVSLALLGTLAVLLTYLLARRLAAALVPDRGLSSPTAAWAGVVAALPLAIYPSLLEYHGMIMSEPLAIFWLSAAVLSFLWASDGRPLWAWALPGLLFGMTALTRPEYLTFGAVFAVLAIVRLARDGRAWRPRLLGAGAFLAAFLIPIVPWTVHNYVSLHRFVPLSTGGSKALFIGTYYPGDGMNDKTKSVLLADNPGLRRFLFTEKPRPQPSLPTPWLSLSLPQLPKDGIEPRRLLSQDFEQVNFVFLDQILDTLAAERHPGLPVDAALSKDAKHNFWHYWTTKPLPYAWMYAKKTWHMWRAGPRDTMKLPLWRAFHLAIVLLALTALIALAIRRRWEATVIGALTLGITAEGTLLLAAERRVLVLLPLISTLAGAATVWLAHLASKRRSRPAA
ncbi:MAG: hypothetical protein QOJ38_593 [Solirubrobacterales bacterium]|nr:hypothetical protein [Solirubrobacterales bacterium]